MAIIAYAGAEDGLDEVTRVGTVALDGSVKRSGSYSFRLQSGTDAYYQHAIILSCPARSTIFFQGAARLTSTGSYGDWGFIAWRYGSTILGCITVDSWQTGMKVWVGNKSTNVGSVAIGLSTVFTLIEVKVIIADSGGVIEVKGNGVPLFSFTGDTKPGSDTTINNFICGMSPYLIQNVYTYWDDLIIADDQGSDFNNGTRGAKIYRCAPSGVGNYSQWTPAGSTINYQCVDETPASMSDYVYASDTGLKDSYQIGDAPTSGIGAVAIRYWGSGGESIKRLCRYNSTDYLGTTINLSNSFSYVDDIMYLTPSGTTWDTTTFNAMEIGMEKE